MSAYLIHHERMLMGRQGFSGLHVVTVDAEESGSGVSKAQPHCNTLQPITFKVFCED